MVAQESGDDWEGSSRSKDKSFVAELHQGPGLPSLVGHVLAMSRIHLAT